MSLGRLLVVMALAMALPACGHAQRRVVVDLGPPPPTQAEEPTYLAGHVWIPGNWERRDARWVWRRGHHERERPGHDYVAGRWCNEDGRWIWLAGAWRKSGRVVVFER